MGDWNRPFLHSTPVRTNNSTRARLGWTLSYIYCIFVHPNLNSVPLFVGMRERSIAIGDGLLEEWTRMRNKILAVWVWKAYGTIIIIIIIIIIICYHS